MKKTELKERISAMQAKAWEVWSEAHELAREVGRDDQVFFNKNCGIKTKTLSTIDSLQSIHEHLCKQCED